MTLDRAAHRRTDGDWQREAWERARVLVVTAGKVPVDGTALVLVPSGAVPDGERYFLGVDDAGVPLYAVTGEPPDGLTLANLRDIGHLLGEADRELMMTAVALVNWHVRHQYSPKTGRPTTVGEAGWTRVTDDGETWWPRTDPAVIVLVHDGVPGPAGRCLLGRNAQWSVPGPPRYSCLAGFVEPGESAEATVLREVAEEVGIVVHDVRYVASQPWPFPGSLMIGFSAVGDPAAEIVCAPDEIADARWFRRDEVGAVLSGEREDFGLPSNVSIASSLVRWWQAEKLP